uniref:Uncharacterized protein n=1 Tax=Physcomitrium patens TaxID=3218 RepID=A0A2K1KPF1_PHYPA|nr:hypothetical protein PHYPA_006555 [Physcomitrium patens]
MPDGSAQESFHAKKWVGLIPTQGLQWKLCASICIQPLLFDGYLAPTEFPRVRDGLPSALPWTHVECDNGRTPPTHNSITHTLHIN